MLLLILKEHFEMTPEDIKLLADIHIQSYRNLYNLTLAQIDQMLVDGHIFTGTHGDICLYNLYMSIKKQTHKEFMLMTADIWNDMDKHDLDMCYNAFTVVYRISHLSIKHSVTRSGQTPTGIPSKNVHTSNLLKYTKFKLTGKDSIMKFYRDVQTQGLQYNVELMPFDNIDSATGVISVGIS